MDYNNLKILYDLSNKKLDLSEFQSKIDAQLRSYQIAGIDISKYNLSDLFPNKQQFLDFETQRNEKLNFLFQEIKDPDVLSFYEKFKPFVDILENKINNQKLNTDLTPNKIAFNPTGSKDGRLSIKKGYLNIYSLSKEDRHLIRCSPEHRFVQFDYRSFQPRLAIFLTEDEQFKKKFTHKEDIYDTPGIEREQQKLNFFRIMFGIETSEQLQLRPIFDLRQQIYKEISTKEKIISPFGRPIHFNNQSENVVFRNYITTCEADFVYGTTLKLDKLLSGKQSKIKWLFYDAIMLEIHKDESKLTKQIKDIMENDNMFNVRFPVKVSVGKDFGNLKSLQ